MLPLVRWLRRPNPDMGVVDLGKVQKETAFIKKALKHFGLPSTVGEAIAALARTIRDHKHMETLLTETLPEDRQDFYDAIRPHLRFQAKPLDVYVSGAGQMAEREQLPTMDAQGMLHPFKPSADVKSLEKHAGEILAQAIAKRTLTVTCHKCLAQEQFYQVGDETEVGVMIRVRAAGWVYDAHRETETCPKCSAN